MREFILLSTIGLFLLTAHSEVSAQNTIDAGVVEILSPGTLGSEGDVVWIQVRVTNFGSTTLYNAYLAYCVNDGNPVTYNYLMPLAPGDTIIVYLPSYTLIRGENHICAFTQVSGDSNATNDTTCQLTYAEFSTHVPYYNTFDQTVGELWADSVPNQWERGIPSGATLNSANSPPNVWATSLDSQYTHNGFNYLYTPYFNHLVYGIDSLMFWQQLDLDSGASAWIEYLGILGWKKLGSPNDSNAINWYNGADSTWKGTGCDTTYFLSAYHFPGLYNAGMAEPTRFRFVFHTTQANTYDHEGWMIDDLRLNKPIYPSDAGVVQILAPKDTIPKASPMSVEVQIRNFSSDTLFAIPVKYQIDGIVSDTGIWTGMLPPDSLGTYIFSAVSAPISDFELCAHSDLAGDIISKNDSVCDYFTIRPLDKDIGVTDILSPPSAIMAWDTFPVRIVIENFGLNPVDSFGIHYEIPGIDTIHEIWNDPVHPLLPGDTLHYRYQTDFSYIPTGSFCYLCCHTTLQGDYYLLNDERCRIIEIYGNGGMAESTGCGFQLGQNIPNPTTRMTTIPLTLSVPGKYVLSISNIYGEFIRQEQGFGYQGENRIEISRVGLRPGIYFYSIEFNGFRQSKKMIVQGN